MEMFQVNNHDWINLDQLVRVSYSESSRPDPSVSEHGHKSNEIHNRPPQTVTVHSAAIDLAGSPPIRVTVQGERAQLLRRILDGKIWREGRA